MIPTEEEKQKIQEAQLANPDIPLGSAEQFLLTLSSISELSARLHLWAFKMDYDVLEKVRTFQKIHRLYSLSTAVRAHGTHKLHLFKQ